MTFELRYWRRGLVTITGLAAAVAIVGCQPQTPLDNYGATPSFNLTDQSGATFSSQSLAGHVTLLDFIYTNCTDACPIMSATFQDAARKLAQDNLLGSKVMLVSLSVDPVHDIPPVMADYAQEFKADPNSWKMLTGDFDSVYDVITGFKVATRPPRPAADSPAPGGTELTHTTAVMLIDPQLQVRAILDGTNASADDLISAAKRLIK
ncbi:MAG TPA: SCO family protein [Chloroflexota bacterium]|jgi:protein SCO1/2